MHWVNSWLWGITGLVPPFCVEVILRDTSRYYLQSVLDHDKQTDTGVIRIWDLRAFTDADLEDLKARLNDIRDRSQLSPAEKVHPRLDWANVYLHTDDVAYCIEWHDRLWPQEERPQIGFR
ncbi:MAG: hypothetical protein AUH29_11920 [Candidatus Rokubacteria bacterium 13_1_40CM_69_27]|nr:MAG: hypothetical protein AUH29_11920 [Candidatus Rokubacteria bacterium 13_1_40CM_69_27]OLC38363.1 MAG: hypothetical protein AUH81_04220 [Candidatus Rokubacteria bacterium 13_1_40CM_4_69_5]